MMPRLRRLVNLLLALIGIGLLLLAGTALVPIAQGASHLALPVVAAAGLVLVAGWLLHDLLRSHFDDLKLLYASLQVLARGEVPPEQLQTRWAGGRVDEVGQLARIVIELAARRAGEAARPDQRLAAVIGALADAVVVITERGQISLINAAGKALLGQERAAVGTSIYAALDRRTLIEALEQARHARRRAVAVRLRTVLGEGLAARITDFGEHAGAVITIAASAVAEYAEVEHAMDLHDVPPPAKPPLPDTPLDDLPGTVLDTETTGLDIAFDSICAIAAVRVHGGHIFRGLVLDRLVNPGRSIPARSTAVHGITSAMVAAVPGPEGVLPDLLAMTRNTVVIGHNIGFDLAVLRRTAQQVGLEWRDPPWLDTLLLAAALDPQETDLNLESVALRLGVDAAGRHTALGDTLVTAEIFVRLLPLLAERGITTFGAAVEFSQRAKQVLASQKKLGW